MKQIIILVATIALGIFIASQLTDFKAPVEKNIGAATKQMNDSIITSP